MWIAHMEIHYNNIFSKNEVGKWFFLWLYWLNVKSCNYVYMKTEDEETERWRKYGIKQCLKYMYPGCQTNQNLCQMILLICWLPTGWVSFDIKKRSILRAVQGKSQDILQTPKYSAHCNHRIKDGQHNITIIVSLEKFWHYFCWYKMSTTALEI